MFHLSGNAPTFDQVKQLSLKDVQKWAELLGISADGRLDTIQKRIASHLKVSVTPSGKRQPKRTGVETSEKSRTGSSQEPDVNSSDVDYLNALLQNLSDSSDSEEVQTVGSSSRADYFTQREFENFATRLIEKVEMLTASSSNSQSLADIDWWLKQVCEFKLGVQLKSRSLSAEEHINPHLKRGSRFLGAEACPGRRVC